MIKTILLDMDGVCCDFITAACRIHHEDPEHVLERWEPGERDICQALGITTGKFWAALEGQASFWRYLQAYPWFGELRLLLKEFCQDVVILTSPSRCPSAHYGKAMWLKDHGICPARGAILGSRKDLLAKPGAVLIDDSDANCQAFRNCGGESILFPQRWNELHDMPEDVDRLDYLRNALQVLSERKRIRA